MLVCVTTLSRTMTMDKFFLFTVLASFYVLAVSAEEGECQVSGASRVECGWLGITEEQCGKRGCCWDSSDPNAKWCFVKKGQHLQDGQCPVAPSERKDCGHYGITKDECLGKYCCWDDSVENTPWCFKEPMPQPGCTIYHGVYGTCRYTCHEGEEKAYGKGECHGRICCYTESYSGESKPESKEKEGEAEA